MNRNQKIVIFIVLVLFLCCGIFVPYDGVHGKENLFLGYFPIFSPPSKRDIVKSFYKKNDLERDYKNLCEREEQEHNFYKERNTDPTFNYPAYSPSISKEKYLEQQINDILDYGGYEANINLSRLIIQIFILLIITAGLFLLFAGKNKKD